jgi:NTE family protein
MGCLARIVSNSAGTGAAAPPSWSPRLRCHLSIRHLRPVLLLVAVLAADLAANPAIAADRPIVGLVLGGGGARGAAHIGVLEVLEQLRVPVDCVAGTSMGALVAGAWAAGLDAATMRREMAGADWHDMFQDNPAFTEFNYRNKRLSQRYLPGSETGVTPQGLTTPPGVVSGQKIKLFFNQLVHADAGERAIETLALPVSIIATDIGSGERVVFRDGSLTLAMRASMSVPGLMAPLDYRGRKLVDGGLVDNVPIREVRERCGAQVVIAVNVGSPLLKPGDINGLLSVSAQMVNILTEQNVTQSLATLTPADIYLQPDLGTLGAGDFERNGEAADLGRKTALAASAALQRLAVDERSYASWQRKRAGRPAETPRVDEIEIAGLQAVNPAALSRYIDQRLGEPLDAAALNRSLLRAYGDGSYQQVDYSLLRLRDRNVLRIAPVEKSWGPDYLRVGLNLNSTLTGGSTYSLRTAYQKTLLNRLGGELLFAAELGSDTGAGAEWYQPIDAAQRYFVEASGSVRRQRSALYLNDVRLTEFRNDVTRADLVGGINIGLLGQARLGWREERRAMATEVGPSIGQIAPLRTSGWLASVELDQLNRLYLPTAGWSFKASSFESNRQDYNRLALVANGVTSVGDWVLALRGTYTGAVRGKLPFQDLASLGGFLNLSGFADDQLLGDKVAYSHVRAERIIGRMPLGLRGDMRVGMALEAGRVGRPVSEAQRTGVLNSGAVYLGGETPFGPIYVGFGYSTSGASNAYLSIGTP